MEDKLNLDSSENNLEKTFCIFIGVLCFNLLFIVILFLMTLHSKILGENLVGTVLAALIGVIGVLAGFVFNKRQTYKEIVTRERIEWLHKIQEKLALYLDLTSLDNEQRREKLEEDYKNTVDKLYYEIIFNINHHKDKKALKALEKYHKEYEIRRKRESKKDKLKDKVIEEFVKIFNKTWRDIKGEAF